jgi:phosphoserine phosphatase RsbU/P
VALRAAGRFKPQADRVDRIAVDNPRTRLPRMAGYTIVAGAIYLVGLATTRFLPGNILGILHDLGAAALAVSLLYYVFRLLRWLKARLLWKVRNRIIVSFAFVGVIPLVILLAISSLVTVIILKRLSGFYLELEIEALANTLERAGRSAAINQLQQGGVSVESLRRSAEEGLRSVPPGLRNAVFHIYDRSVATGDAFRWLDTVTVPDFPQPPEAPTIPSWMRDGFSGLTTNGESVNFTSAFDLTGGYRLILQLPLDDRTMDFLHRRTSLELILTHANPRDHPREFQETYASLGQDQEGIAITWVHFFRPVEWESGQSADMWSLGLSVPARTLVEHFFAQDTGSLVLLIGALLVAFVIVQFISLVIGGAIARSITLSIHNIYAAVQGIQRGEFNVRIPVRRPNDQLAQVADSFNEMSASIVHLMEEVSKRERLEKELEIAREVQNQLFPQKLPSIRSLEIAASCTPARQVGGDYYDFLAPGPNRLDIVVGDISGKGISAALLMASLQSTIRSGLGELDGDPDPRRRIVRVVAEVNRQLYRRSSPESYSTLVLTHFDADTLKLCYCNAGHHPPLLFSGGHVSGLTEGGTVVGLFENWDFRVGEAQLRPGDLLVYFTDGVVEAENSQGEQLTTQRLIEIVRRNTFLTADDTLELILEQVFDWSAGVEQADDITLVCLKIVEGWEHGSRAPRARSGLH